MRTFCAEAKEKRIMQTVTYRLPAYWASALINDDRSDITDEDDADMGEFFEAHPELGSAIDCGEAEFSWSNDWTNLGGDVCEYIFQIIETQ
jgi:hypothetical protein